MGADPLGITVSLSLPGDTSVAWVEALYQGMVACLQHYHTVIVGGDVCRSPIITVSIAAFGQVLPNQAIRRSNARPGDTILVTGVHGASRAGLELLLNPALGENLAPPDRLSLIRAHQHPKPRLDVIPVLRELLEDWKTQENRTPPRFPDSPIARSPDRPIAGMDSSDGLADAVLQICRSSGVGAELERSQIPIPAGLSTWISDAQALDWALYGGEDFELVLTLPPVIAEGMVERLGNGAAIVGTITDGSDVVLTDRTDTYSNEILTLSRGFQHF